MTGITRETFDTAPGRPEENARESDEALVNFLLSVRKDWNHSCKDSLIVGHKGRHEDEELFRLNAQHPELNARALNLDNISGCNPWYLAE